MGAGGEISDGVTREALSHVDINSDPQADQNSGLHRVTQRVQPLISSRPPCTLMSTRSRFGRIVTIPA